MIIQVWGLGFGVWDAEIIYTIQSVDLGAKAKVQGDAGGREGGECSLDVASALLAALLLLLLLLLMVVFLLLLLSLL